MPERKLLAGKVKKMKQRLVALSKVYLRTGWAIFYVQHLLANGKSLVVPNTVLRRVPLLVCNGKPTAHVDDFVAIVASSPKNNLGKACFVSYTGKVQFHTYKNCGSLNSKNTYLLQLFSLLNATNFSKRCVLA